MNTLLSKTIIILLCLITNLNESIDIYFIASFFFSILISALLDFLNSKIKWILIFVFFILLFIWPELIIFLPLLVYDIYEQKYKYYFFLFLIPIFLIPYSFADSCLYILLSFTAILFKFKDIRLASTIAKYLSFINESREKNIYLNLQNKTILEQETLNIEVAILKERERISKNIHDDVGHLITRSLLQIAALSLKTKDEELNRELLAVKSSLDQSMNQIRESVHNIHKASINLNVEITKLLDDFNFCPVTFEYNIITKLPLDIAISLVSITKECLTNVMKHSNATAVKISFNELPTKYTFLIIDNGTQIPAEQNEGMGLYSIKDRVKAFDGKINIFSTNGYRILITLDKETIR